MTTATSNFPFTKAVEIPLGVSIKAARFLGSKSGAWSQDLDTTEDQRKIVGVVERGVAAGNETDRSSNTYESGRTDRTVSVVMSAGVRVVLEAGGAISEGDLLTADGDGKAVEASSGKRILALALEDAPETEAGNGIYGFFSAMLLI